jgi:hypothetical protein
MGCLHVKPNGIAACCDWILLSDTGKPHYRLVNQAGVAAPRTIFISLRGGLQTLEYFEEFILPKVSGTFVLITGSEDLTIPSQNDSRWIRACESTGRAIARILNAESVLHWYAENLDEKISDKISPLPLGFILEDGQPEHTEKLNTATPLEERETSLFCCHRIREGDQWNERRIVSEWLENSECSVITHIRNEVSSIEYSHFLSRAAFVMCVSGGGIDPCPKAFQALQHGAVPIIKSGPLNPCFKDLPVWIVDDWCDVPLTSQELKEKQMQIARQLPPAHVLASRLSLDYWWATVQERVRTP